MTDPNPSSSIPHVPHVPVRTGCRARAFVLGGISLALAVTVFSVATGTGVRFLGAIWFWAVIWTILAALACVLWRGLRYRDWSAFGGYELPKEGGDRFDWATRTGRYAWLRDVEDPHLHDTEHLRGHGPSSRFP